MSPNELQYYRGRASIERGRFNDASNEFAAEVHLTLACLYDALIKLEENKPPILMVVRTDRYSQGPHGV